jgi:hypothetical protein
MKRMSHIQYGNAQNKDKEENLSRSLLDREI